MRNHLSPRAWLLWFLCGAASAAPPFVYSPYKHLAISPMQSGSTSLTWAFATGECGREVWGKETGFDVARAHVPAARNGYIISTGGEGGVFTCASDEGMEAFIQRYQSPYLLGLDFDIEASQSAEQVASLMARIGAAQVRHPRLRMSFTIATLAASDGSKGSLNAQSESVLAAIKKQGLRDYALNLMVMDFGPAEAKNCVLRGSRCDMGASALQAARNVSEKYGVPLAHIELTAMIGVNDVIENVFDLDDARVLRDGARTLGLAGIHFWSQDRDKPCAEKGAVAHCSGLPLVTNGAFERAMNPLHSQR